MILDFEAGHIGDFVLQEGAAVTASGSVELGDQRSGTLWLAGMWTDSPAGRRTVGGDIAVEFSGAPPTNGPITVEGVWRGRSIIDATWSPGSGPIVNVGPHPDGVPFTSMSNSEFSASIAGEDRHYDDVVISSGGEGRTGTSVLHVAFVTDRLAEWFRTRTGVRLRVCVGIVPTAVLRTAPERATVADRPY